MRGEIQAGVRYDNEKVLEKNTLYLCPIT